MEVTRIFRYFYVPNLGADYKLSNQASISICFFNLTNDLWFHSPLAASRINVALSSTAIQSTTSLGGLAERSIDGNNDPQWEHNSCSLTAGQARAWWRLELPGVYRVSEIEVTNRNSWRWRLNNVEILIGDSLSNNGNDNPR